MSENRSDTLVPQQQNPLLTPPSAWPFPTLPVKMSANVDPSTLHGPGAPTSIGSSPDVKATASAAAASAGKVREGYNRAADNLQSETRSLTDKLGSLDKNIDESMQRIRAAQDKSDESTRAAMDMLKAAPKQPDLEGVQHFGGIATVIGILGGLFTRQPLQASLNAAGAAMEAYNHGDLTKYKIAYDTWKTNSDLMFKIADMNAKRVRDIMTDETLGLSERRSLLDVTLRGIGLERLADESRIRGDEAIYDFDKTMFNASEQWEKQRFQMELADKRWRDSLEKNPVSRITEMGIQEFTQKNGRPPNFEEVNSIYKSVVESSKSKPITDTASGSTPSEIAYWTNVLKQGGSLPPGLSRTASGSKLVQEIMKNMADSGDPGDFIEKHATVKANSTSLNNMTKMADAAISFERLANKNFDVALSLAKDAIPTNLGPLFNRWVETGQTNFGNEKVPAYMTALMTASNEYAKVMSGSTGTAASTVDARTEARDHFSPYLSNGQIEAVVAVAKRDMANRENELLSQVDNIRSRLKTGESQQPSSSTTPTNSPSVPIATPATSQPSGTVFYYDTKGNLVPGP